MPTTTRTVFEAMAPTLDGVDLDEVFAPDGTLRTRCSADRHTATFAAWAWAVSDAAPMRPVDDLMSVTLMGNEDARRVAQSLMDWADTERAAVWRSFVAFTEPMGRWRAPSSREMAGWPTPERITDIFTETLTRLN
jgi:hypothetical protein